MTSQSDWAYHIVSTFFVTDSGKFKSFWSPNLLLMRVLGFKLFFFCMSSVSFIWTILTWCVGLAYRLSQFMLMIQVDPNKHCSLKQWSKVTENNHLATFTKAVSKS